MRFDGVVVIEESDEFCFAVGAVLEDRLPVPHLHERPYHSLRIPAVFGAVVRIGLLDGVRTFIDDLFEKLLTQIPCLIREDCGEEFP